MASLNVTSSGSPYRMSSGHQKSLTMNMSSVASPGGQNSLLRDDLTSGRLKLTPAIRQPLPSSRMSLAFDMSLKPDEMDLLTFNNTVGPLSKTLASGLWPNVSDKLYTEFLESVLLHGPEQQVFDIIRDFIQNCDNTLEVLREPSSKIGDRKTTVWLENERNTWRLLFCLYQNRVSTSQSAALEFPEDRGDMNVEMDDGLNSVSRKLSESYVVTNLYENDAVVRECQLVIDWLEQCAADRKKDMDGPQIGHFTDKRSAWENTLHQLVKNDDGVVYSSRRPMVCRLDPDAPIRERRPLHDVDEKDEARLMQHVFLEIRCGRLEAAQSLCYHCGQPWRAAVLEGWRLHNDPNYTNNSTNGKEPVEGNPNRDLWRICAWRASEDHRVPLYARATLAAHCGNLKVLLTACSTWADVLWGHLRCVADVRVEREIRSQIHRTYIDMPEEYWQNELSLERIFAELASSPHETVREESQKPDHKVQELLILEQIGLLLTEMECWAKRGEPQMLRFLAHLVLVLRLLGHSDHAGDQVLREYVKVLVGMREPRLVAHYVAMLPQDDQVQEYASFLMTVVDNEERQTCLAVAEEAGLDIEKITKTVVENIRRQEKSTRVSEQTTASDLEKISALDWVVFYPSQRAEALWQANALMRSFLAAGKLDAAARAFEKIPMDTITTIFPELSLPETPPLDARDGSFSYRASCSVREYLALKEYLCAQERFSDWFQHYHNAKPVKPTQPSPDAAFQEKIAYDHRTAQYQNKFEHWKKTMNSLTKTVRTQLYNVLLFPDGGWLVDPTPTGGQAVESMEFLSEGSEMECRQRQMEQLRRLYIPKVVLLLHTVLHEMGEYAECVRLADLIANEMRQLYSVYSKEDLGDLLVKIAESSLALLEQKKDPWGLPPM